MSEIDKMAEEFAADRVPFGDYGHGDVVAAIRAALLTAPPGWKLVPIPPTYDMIDAAHDAYMPFGDMHFAITSAILAAPEPK